MAKREKPRATPKAQPDPQETEQEQQNSETDSEEEETDESEADEAADDSEEGEETAPEPESGPVAAKQPPAPPAPEPAKPARPKPAKAPSAPVQAEDGNPVVAKLVTDQAFGVNMPVSLGGHLRMFKKGSTMLSAAEAAYLEKEPYVADHGGEVVYLKRQ